MGLKITVDCINRVIQAINDAYSDDEVAHLQYLLYKKNEYNINKDEGSRIIQRYEELRDDDSIILIDNEYPVIAANVRCIRDILYFDNCDYKHMITSKIKPLIISKKVYDMEYGDIVNYYKNIIIDAAREYVDILLSYDIFKILAYEIMNKFPYLRKEK